MAIHDISVVVFGNRKDYFFTKICISSIRYYYPDVEILLVKDQLNGNYDTSSLRKAFNVKLLNFDKKYFGWGASKVHFILRKDMPRKRYLILDSDIIFIGKVIEKIANEEADFVVAGESPALPFSDHQKELFVDPVKIRKYYPEYEYPGFFFNTGQMIVSPGLVSEDLIAPGFNPHSYPYFKDWEMFKTVDQSVLNAAIPVLLKRKQLTIANIPFMRWSVTYFENCATGDVNQYLDGETGLLVHYCGDIRTYELARMKGQPVLQFFKNQYTKRLSTKSRFRDSMQDWLASKEWLLNIYKWRNDRYLKILNRLNHFIKRSN